MIFDKLIDICKDKKVWIQTHNFPDPDAVASAFGLQSFLLNYGIETRLCYDGEIDKLSTTKMLDLIGASMRKSADLKDMGLDDVIILVDCQKNTGNTTDFIGDELAVIDHHPVFNDIKYEYADLRITGACSSLIAQYYKEAMIDPPSNVATALLYGIRMDTLQFSRSVTMLDIEMFGFLFPFVDQNLLTDLETNNIEFQDLHGYGAAIDNIKIYGVVGFSYLDFPCSDALVGILSDFLLGLVEVDVVVLYAKRANGVKFSLRSERPEVHAGLLAKEGLKNWGDGGGHATMAGGFAKNEFLPENAEMRFQKVQDHFIDVIKDMYPHIL